MIPAILGMAAGAALMGFSTIQSMAPHASNAISACLTDDITNTQQRSYSNNPTKELDASTLTHARIKSLISHSQYQAGLSRLGLSSGRADTLLQSSYNLLGIENLANSYFKGDIDKNTYLKKSEKAGFKADEANLFLISYRSIPAVENLINNLWRGDISTEVYHEKMHGLGYEPEDADLLIKSHYFIPNHEDLIRFQVREVYNDPVVEKYGYDEEFPTNIIPDAHKIGMNEETMRKYWRAHWELPSPTQAYNMLQRLNPEVLQVQAEKYRKMNLDPNDIKTDLTTLRELLKVADYPKFWRDRLIAISYDPITRVDLRRIYQLGLCSDKFVVASLMEHGYTSDDANLLLEFYKDLKHGKDKELTVNTLLKGYQYGYVSKSELTTELTERNYSKQDIEVLLNTNKAILEEKDFKDYLEVLKVEYVHGNLNEPDIRAKLGLKGISSKRIDVILAKFKQANRKSVKLPSIPDLKDFYKKSLINDEQFLQGLTDIGIPTRYRDYYLSSVKGTNK